MARRPDTPCADCGMLMWSSTTSLPPGQRRCRPCRRARPTQPDPRPCEHCGETFTPQRARVRFCSQACKYAARVTRPQSAECTYCGTTFTPCQPDQQCCSQRCANRLRAGWSTCTDLVHVPRRLVKPTPPAQTWWTHIVSGSCHHCGSAFTAPSSGSDASYCSDTCTLRAKGGRRTAAKRGGYVASVNRAQIIRRDAGRCQICRRKVDPTKTVPHPKAPTIDHIIPLANGGTHEPANVQLACFQCNCRKSNTGVGDQLRLIG